MGEMLRAFYLKKHAVSYEHSTAVFFTERFFDLLLIITLAIVSAILLQKTQWEVIISSAVLIVSLAIFAKIFLHQIKSLEKWFLYFSNNKIKKILHKCHEVLGHTFGLMQKRFIFTGLFTGTIAWLAEAYSLYLILHYLGFEITITQATFVYTISLLIGVISFLPGGLGSTEASMIILLKTFGVDIDTAIAATLIFRVSTLWFSFLIGLLAVFQQEYIKRKKLFVVKMARKKI